MFGRLRDEQDAHELWALLAEALADEAGAVGRSLAQASAGLKALARLPGGGREEEGGEGEVGKPPWEGRMAYRRACAVCGYADGGVRLMPSGEVSLALPAPSRTVRCALLPPA